MIRIQYKLSFLPFSLANQSRHSPRVHEGPNLIGKALFENFEASYVNFTMQFQ